MVKYPPNKGTLKTKISRGLHERIFNDAYVIFFFLFFFFIKAYVVGTHLNCPSLSR